MILLWHVGHDATSKEPCLGPAFGVMKRHGLDEMPAENVVKLNGSKPVPGEGMICGSCHQPVRLAWLSYSQPSSRLAGVR